MNNENKKEFYAQEITLYAYPGVLQLECIPENRAYIIDVLNVFLDSATLFEELYFGTYKNQELVKDFKKYGNDSFKYSVVVCDVDYLDEEKRKAALADAKTAWKGELY